MTREAWVERFRSWLRHIFTENYAERLTDLTELARIQIGKPALHLLILVLLPSERSRAAGRYKPNTLRAFPHDGGVCTRGIFLYSALDFAPERRVKELKHGNLLLLIT
jgi:hypothetical protein